MGFLAMPRAAKKATTHGANPTEAVSEGFLLLSRPAQLYGARGRPPPTSEYAYLAGSAGA